MTASMPQPSAAPASTGRTVHMLDRSGHLRDWLVSPAWTSECADLAEVVPADGSPWGPGGRWVLTNGPDVAPLKKRLYARHPIVTDQPLPEVAEGGEIRWVAPGGVRTDEGRWRRVHTGWDGVLDWSRFCHTPEYQHSIAAAYLEVDQPEYRTLEVACTGPFTLWVGDEPVLSGDEFGYMEPSRSHVRVRLRSGATRVVLATWQVAFRECRHVAALRVAGLPVRVVLPSPQADEYAAAAAERALDSVAAWPWALPDDTLTLTGPVGADLRLGMPGQKPRRVRLAEGHASVSLAEAVPTGTDAVGGGSASMLGTGETTLEISFDDTRAPVSRVFRAASLPRAHRSAPVGDNPQEWRQELLRHARDATPGVARALARLAAETHAVVTTADLAGSLDLVDRRGDCADFEAVGLLQLWHRADADRWDEGLRARVKDALTGFKYWIDQPGLDAMCYFTENHQMVWHTAELLAGETFPDEKFSNTGWLGRQHADHGRELAVAWMHRKLSGGFSEFDSNAYLAIDTLALVSVLDLAVDTEVRHLAEALLDKTLLTLAANSFHGVHGAAHGRTYTTTLRSARFEETAPIMWVLWGTGALNSALLPAVALATSRRYRLPALVRAVATHPGDRWYGRQVYRGQLAPHRDLLDRPYGSDVRVWRTPHVMLSSVQDYRSGLPGLQEHVWGATLGPETQVFATHPGAAVHGPSARPNAWAGQRVLPRARQHQDAVLVLHRIPPDDPVGETHLWFPLPHLDEHRVSGPWLAGRLGGGYVAVATEGGFRPVRYGDEARQRWVPEGPGSAYVVTVGDQATDGDFESFVRRLAASEPEFSTDAAGEPAVGWSNRDRERLELGWSTAFLVDGRCPDLGDAGAPEEPPHLHNPACDLGFGADLLEAEWEGERLVLDLRTGTRREPASAATSDAPA
jgi:hypothetical protein